MNEYRVYKFFDMHSGGKQKTEYSHIYIYAKSESEAIQIFKNKFDQDPFDVYCECCGENFAVSCYDSLEDATNYDKRCKDQNIQQYLANKFVLVIDKGM